MEGFPSLVVNPYHQHSVFGTTNDGQAFSFSDFHSDSISLGTMPSKGKHKAAQIHAKVDRNHNIPTVKIVNQIPTQRFRYNNEGRTGRRNQNRAFLELQPNFVSHQNKYRCTVFCVCDTDSNIPHPNALVGKDCKDGVYCADLKAESKGILKLPHLQIERKKKGDVQETWDLRAKQLLSPYKEKCNPSLLERKFATSKVRLYVHVEALDTHVSACTLSGIITSEREGIQVDIHSLSHYSAAVTGGETIFILTTEGGPDIKPGDFEVFLSTNTWSSPPKSLKAEDILYKKVIKYEVPPYEDTNITDAVTVVLTLNWIRSKQRVTVHFQYRPEPDNVVSVRRHQLKRVHSRDHAGRDGPCGKVMRADPHLTQPLTSMHGKKMTPGLQDDDSEDYLAQSPRPPSASESEYAAQVIEEENSGQAMVYQVAYPGQVYTEDVGEAGERKTYAVLQSSSQPHNMPLSPVSDGGVEREEEMEVQTSQHSQCSEPQNPVVQHWYTGKNPIQLNVGKSSVILYPIEEPVTTAGSSGKQMQYVQAQQCSEDTATTPSSSVQGAGYSRGKIMYEVLGPAPPLASPSAEVAGGKSASETQVLVAGKGKPALQGKTRPTAQGPPLQGKGKPGNIPNFISGLLEPVERGTNLVLRNRDRINVQAAPAPTSSSAPATSASAPATSASAPAASSSSVSGKGSQAGGQQTLLKGEVLVKTECEDDTPRLPSSLPSFGTHLALTTSLPSIPLNLDPKLPPMSVLPASTMANSSLPSFNLANLSSLNNLTSMDIEKDCGPLLDIAKEDASTKS